MRGKGTIIIFVKHIVGVREKIIILLLRKADRGGSLLPRALALRVILPLGGLVS